MSLYDVSGNAIRTERVYVCTDYGVTTENADNTEAFNALVDIVYADGGGIIYIPVGTYEFKSASCFPIENAPWNGLVQMRDNVSVIGESKCDSVLKVTGSTVCTLFGYYQTRYIRVRGCRYENFTVDMSEFTVKNTTSFRGKAFYASGIEKCTFRDLRLLETPGTALGIDMLVDVIIDSVYCYKCGKNWGTGSNNSKVGSAGIGIGTNLAQDENFIITNCICDGCYHFGIFIEDQAVFGASSATGRGRGQVIANNIIRNGKNYAIGLRGGKYVVVSGNSCYNNVGGLYADFGTKHCLFAGNLVAGSTEAGFCYGDESTVACEEVVVSGNAFIENAVAFLTKTASVNCVHENNNLIGNTVNEQVL